MRRLILSAFCLPFLTITNIQSSQVFDCSSMTPEQRRSECNEGVFSKEGRPYCKKESLTAFQREECLRHEEELVFKHSRKPPKYPVRFFSAKTNYDPLSGKELSVFWSAEDKNTLKIKHVQEKKNTSFSLFYSL